MALFSSLVFNRELTLFADPATWRLHGAWLIYTIFLSLLLVHIDTDQLYSTVALGLFEGAHGRQRARRESGCAERGAGDREAARSHSAGGGGCA